MISKAKGLSLLIAGLAFVYSEAPKVIAEKIKSEVNSMPVRVRVVVAWRVLLGRL